MCWPVEMRLMLQVWLQVNSQKALCMSYMFINYVVICRKVNKWEYSTAKETVYESNNTKSLTVNRQSTCLSDQKAKIFLLTIFFLWRRQKAESVVLRGRAPHFFKLFTEPLHSEFNVCVYCWPFKATWWARWCGCKIGGKMHRRPSLCAHRHEKHLKIIFLTQAPRKNINNCMCTVFFYESEPGAGL